MKIEKKHIIIILIVVAVVAYLIWRRNSDTVTDPVTGEEVSLKDDINAILTKIGANTEEKSYVRNFARSVEAKPLWKENVQEKADSNLLTYEQQLVCDALWTKYNGANGWSNPRGWKLIAKVKEL